MQLSPEETGVLVRRAAAGDQRAWDQLVQGYAGLIWSVARLHGLSASDAADVSQVTWLRLVEQVGRLRQPERLAAWLATTTRRESVRVARRAARQVPVGDGADGPGDATADGRVELDERDALLRRAFVGLTPRCRELLGLLLADDNLSYAEVSQILDMPVGSIGPTRARCLACLRRTVDAVGVTADWR
ncbi:MAG TPA: sigma-70 family RNA polymerase sigma factor [Actinomycetota bacterium]|jgi:RNA polymerase sigma factor (sigma-70 family)|nr:sigma-70 family RNA polymerase sigma factor [Actinomycetota bacterium]